MPVCIRRYKIRLLQNLLSGRHCGGELADGQPEVRVRRLQPHRLGQSAALQLGVAPLHGTNRPTRRATDRHINEDTERGLG